MWKSDRLGLQKSSNTYWIFTKLGCNVYSHIINNNLQSDCSCLELRLLNWRLVTEKHCLCSILESFYANFTKLKMFMGIVSWPSWKHRYILSRVTPLYLLKYIQIHLETSLYTIASYYLSEEYMSCLQQHASYQQLLCSCSPCTAIIVSNKNCVSELSHLNCLYQVFVMLSQYLWS